MFGLLPIPDYGLSMAVPYGLVLVGYYFDVLSRRHEFQTPEAKDELRGVMLFANGAATLIWLAVAVTAAIGASMYEPYVLGLVGIVSRVAFIITAVLLLVYAYWKFLYNRSR